jgi:hypothetical protein
MIKINKIEEDRVKIFHMDGDSPSDKDTFVGEVTSNLEFDDARIQIKLEKSDRYYFIFNDSIYVFDKDGRIPNYPRDLYAKALDQLTILLDF